MLDVRSGRGALQDGLGQRLAGKAAGVRARAGVARVGERAASGAVGGSGGVARKSGGGAGAGSAGGALIALGALTFVKKCCLTPLRLS